MIFQVDFQTLRSNSARPWTSPLFYSSPRPGESFVQCSPNFPTSPPRTYFRRSSNRYSRFIFSPLSFPSSFFGRCSTGHLLIVRRLQQHRKQKHIRRFRSWRTGSCILSRVVPLPLPLSDTWFVALIGPLLCKYGRSWSARVAGE